jgi:hypothetical protein
MPTPSEVDAAVQSKMLSVTEIIDTALESGETFMATLQQITDLGPAPYTVLNAPPGVSDVVVSALKPDAPDTDALMEGLEESTDVGEPLTKDIVAPDDYITPELLQQLPDIMPATPPVSTEIEYQSDL